MRTLILLAHGSRRHESNQEVITLTDEVRNKAKDIYESVEYAFLELAEPELLYAIENSVKQGATEITVLPYFLNSGNHVKQDIPAIIDTAMEKYPHCKFNVTVCIGMYEGMAELILNHASESSLKLSS